MSFILKPPCDEGAVQAGRGEALCPSNEGPWVLLATILASSMAFIDGTAVNVALPALQADLGMTATQLVWVIEAYALSLAALLLVGGSLGDRLGRRRVFLAGIVIFALASIWCGLAPTPGQLIAARAFQGVGAALFVPGSLAIIGAAFSEEDRGKAFGTWAGATALTASAGPVLGGWLAEEFSWRWIFFINIPLAAVVIVVALTQVRESRGEAAEGGIDWLGALFGTLGLGALVYGLIESSTMRSVNLPVIVFSL